MAGLAAGVVTAGEVNTPQATQPPAGKMDLKNPATWSFIWTGAAVLYLVGIYIGSIRINRP